MEFNTTLVPSLEKTTQSLDSKGKVLNSLMVSLSLNVSGKDTMANVPISEQFRREYLQELQAHTTQTMIPAMSFILFLALIGVIGNSFVLYVYSRKFTLNGSRVFILFIAAFDLITNLVVIPGEVYQMLHMWDFNKPWLCKIRLYVNACIICVSAQLLTALAVIRYRKVCVPFGWQVSARQAKSTAVLLIFFTMLCAAPYAVINGRYTRETQHPEIFGYECTVDDAFVYTIWPTVNNAFFILLYVGNSATIVVLYVLLGAKTLRHSKTGRQGPVYSTGCSYLTSDYSVATDLSSSGKILKDSEAGTTKSAAEEAPLNNTSNAYHVDISTSCQTVIFFQKGETARKWFAFSQSAKERKDAHGNFGKENQNIMESTQDEENVNPRLENVRAMPIMPEETVNKPTSRAPTVRHGAVQKQNLREEKFHIKEHQEERSNFKPLPEALPHGRSEDKGTSSLAQDTKKNAAKNYHVENYGASKKVLINVEDRSTGDESVKHGDSIQKDFDSVDTTTINKVAATNFKTKVNNAGLQPKRTLKRTTLMLGTISAVYILGFLPFLGLSIYYNNYPKEYKSLSGVSLSVYNVFLRFYLLNSASNAVIYGIFDLTFRAKFIDVFRTKRCCAKS